jgi:DNA-binding CsgD family transcriptional regulator
MPRKLPPATRTSIERLLTGTSLTQVTIAKMCGVSPTMVSGIARAIGISPWARKSKRKPRSRAQMAREREIVRLVTMGRSYTEIGDQFGISRQRVHQIVRTYRDQF